jgi:hypothetical protein
VLNICFFQASSLTDSQLVTIRSMIEKLTKDTSNNVMQVLKLTEPPKNLEEFVKAGIEAGNVNNEQINSIMSFAKEAQKNYVIRKLNINMLSCHLIPAIVNNRVS